jgi:hypothetical protein
MHWDNAQVHTTAIVRQWLVNHSIQGLDNVLLLPRLATANFLIFQKAKEYLADITLTKGTFKKTQERVVKTFTAKKLAAANGYSETKSGHASAVNMWRNIMY